MSIKKWHDDIPDGGVLCKRKNGEIVLITHLSGIYKDATTPNGNTFVTRNLTPLTAAEWWDFAPWQDMDSAPRDGSRVLLLSVSGRIEIGYFYNNCWHDLGNSRLDAKFWLPLPQVSK